ncbi:TetR/AcrR family transcriptional regulator [Brevundimonas diminuta]|uniref:TetR/AcrR family transcriptional regulator n=1 Tax=Brevundimonas diminuta TaxID=293 RepID=UPI003CFD07A7
MVAATRSRSDRGQDKRSDVVAATLRVIARDGLDKASMRAIAQELGCTTGVLTHYFRDKEEMLDVVLTELIAAIEEQRSEFHLGEMDLDRYIDYVCGLLPNTEAQVRWWKVWLAFTTSSFVKQRQSSENHRFYEAIRSSWSATFRKLIAGGCIRSDLNPEDEADVLLAIIDGLGVQVLISPAYLTVERQRRLLTTHFNRLKP